MPRPPFLPVLGLSALATLAFTCAHRVPGADACATLSLRVTGGTAPGFRWSPPCPIERLVVASAGTRVVAWSTVSRDQTNALLPPVQYGVAPAGAARTMQRSDVLATGSTYRVTLYRVPEGGGAPRAVGSTTYVP